MALRALLTTAIAAAALAGASAPAAAEWSWPLGRDAVVSERFSFRVSDRFRAGSLRGLRLRSRRGGEVFAACSGVVSFAGMLPDGRRAVTLRCGRLVATEIGISSLRAAAGRSLVAGESLGSIRPGATLQLGARVAERRDGYLDPLGLLSRRSGSPLLIGARAPRGSRRQPPPRPAPRRVDPRPSGERGGNFVLLGLAWLGLGVSGSAIGAGIALRGRRFAPPRRFARAVRARAGH